VKRLVKVIGLVLVVLVVLALVRQVAIRVTTGAVVRSLTGFDADVEDIRVGILRPSIEVRGLELFNPPDFPNREAIVIERAYVRYSLGMLFAREIHLNEVVLDMPSLVVIRKADGETNLARLGKKAGAKPPAGKEPGASPPTAEPPASKKEPRPLRIDRLTIKLGTATFIDYGGRGPEPRTRTFPMNVERTYTDVTDLNRVAAKLSTEILGNALARIAENFGEKLKASGDAEKLEGGAKDIGNFFKRAFKKTEGSGK
jgi:uncharacterized protein involved in outer membrane biogenesis